MRILNREEIVDLLYGATVYGTGGGGSLMEGIDKIDLALAAGKQFKMVDFDELADDDLLATPYSCGAISPLSEADRKKYARLPDFDNEHYNMALRQMEQYLGKPIRAVISTELGGGNSAKAMYCAAMADMCFVDADAAGRAVPALQHSTYCIFDVPICPMSIMNRFGEGAVITSTFDDERAEDLVRALAMASQNHVAVVDHVNTAAVLKKATIPGAPSDALRMGKAFRLAKEAGGDYAAACAEAGNGKVVFRGVVKSNPWSTKGGYTVGERLIEGTGEWQGHNLKIWYQNENIIAWLDGEPLITAPDLICLLDDATQMPLLNPYGDEGTPVTVLCLPAPECWTTPKGLELFSPRFFGFDVDYKPFFKG